MAAMTKGEREAFWALSLVLGSDVRHGDRRSIDEVVTSAVNVGHCVQVKEADVRRLLHMTLAEIIRGEVPDDPAR